MLEVIEYIKAKGLQSLADNYHVNIRRHGTFPNLVMLKYDQIESPMGEKVVQQCRGLILDEADGWRIVAYPYDKFFNYGEGHAAPIDWATARVYEKLDGSLMILYHYAGEWRVASSGLPDASGPAIGSGKTFAELFWETWGRLGYRLPHDIGHCYMFELLTPHNRIIVPQSRGRIVLHGVRCRNRWVEFGPESMAQLHGWECVASYPLNTLDGVVEAAKALNPMQCEGYVVRDAQFRRIKVKSPQYVALAHLKESMGVRRLLEIVRANESSEFLTYFPEWRGAYGMVRGAYDALVSELETAYGQIEGIESQKDFALRATKTRCGSALFAVRAGKAKTIPEYLGSCTIYALERALGYDKPGVADALLASMLAA